MRSRRSPRGYGRSVQHRAAMVAELLDRVAAGHMEISGTDRNGDPTFGLTAAGRRALAEESALANGASS